MSQGAHNPIIKFDPVLHDVPHILAVQHSGGREGPGVGRVAGAPQELWRFGFNQDLLWQAHGLRLVRPQPHALHKLQSTKHLAPQEQGGLLDLLPSEAALR